MLASLYAINNALPHCLLFYSLYALTLHVYVTISAYGAFVLRWYVAE